MKSKTASGIRCSEKYSIISIMANRWLITIPIPQLQNHSDLFVLISSSFLKEANVRFFSLHHLQAVKERHSAQLIWQRYLRLTVIRLYFWSLTFGVPKSTRNLIPVILSVSVHS